MNDGSIGTVHVRGLRELNRAFRLADDGLRRELRSTLADAAEPVQRAAERKVRQEIRNMTDDWSEMRIGVTQKLVYVVPQKRGTKVKRRKRPNLAELMAPLMDESLVENEQKVVSAVDSLIGDLEDRWGRF